MSVSDFEDALTIREAAEYLKIHPVTMYRHAENGTIPGYKIGSIWRFHRNTLEKLLRGELKSQAALRSQENIQ